MKLKEFLDCLSSAKDELPTNLENTEVRFATGPLGDLDVLSVYSDEVDIIWIDLEDRK